MKDPKYLEGIVDRTVIIQDFPRKVDLDLKISAFILTLEKLRRIRRPKQEPMEYEEFEQCELFFDTDKIVLAAPEHFLGSICRPDAKVFKTFEKALKKAFDLLQDYWKILNDPAKSPRERRTASIEKIRQLEREGVDDSFYGELSRCVQINDALARIFGSCSP